MYSRLSFSWELQELSSVGFYSDLYSPREYPHLFYLDLQSIRSFIPTFILSVQPTESHEHWISTLREEETTASVLAETLEEL
jgi:hypothetical protein